MSDGVTHMPEDKFRWFSEDIEIEAEDFVSTSRRKFAINCIIDMLENAFYPVFLLSLSVGLVTYLFNLNPIVFSVELNVILMSIAVMSFLFLIFAFVRRAITPFILILHAIGTTESYTVLYRLFMVSAWLFCCMYWFKLVSLVFEHDFVIARLVIIAGLVTSVGYSITTIVMVYFEGFFIGKALECKLACTNKSEGILRALKNYRCDVPGQSDMSSPVYTYAGVLSAGPFSIPLENASGTGSVNGSHAFAGGLQVDPPEIYNVIDAKTLAKDVFYKASINGEYISPDDFSSIFPDAQEARDIYPFFDSDNNKIISKRDFRDAVINMYMERVNLEKGIEREQDFVDVVMCALNIVTFFPIFFSYLVIFDAPLKEFLALALSSALALNFIASGVAMEMYRSFMMLVTHQFDISDEIIVDGIDYRVHEFGLTTTSLICENGGKLSFLNSDLWNKKLINMTRAPEKIIVFNFRLDPNITTEDFIMFKGRIREFVRTRGFDYESIFSIQAKAESFTCIDMLDCSMILKFKGHKTKSRKFFLRVEMTTFLRSLILEMKVGLDKQ